ncbi:hypothetical protein WH96_11365 [Kiloniella spongiae]|uniref:HTH cro/C1-type domain-containing protein n=1 Tax=Kiloniella spongiae TaxID=1489064 RepID=A0A0H2MDR0_9PROT|nr:helix-turn-helix transcriptional regulator [Kiloniella spongiae]KLN60351.1 hypothetical protein WH96_11365 [Kiloniella spongiae]
MNKNFAKNLKYLCAEKGPVAQVCREIGIVQQQFSKYLRGPTMPSAHTLHKICVYFGVTETEILAPHDDFLRENKVLKSRGGELSNHPLFRAFPGELAKLRPLLGIHHIFFKPPAWPKSIVVGATFLHEENGQIQSRTIEGGIAPDGSNMESTRFEGLLCYQGGRIFVCERERHNEGGVIETILLPAHRQNKRYHMGVFLGMTWQPRRFPFAANIVWRKASSISTAREVLSECGVYPENSPKIDAIVRKHLDQGM